MEAQLKRAGSPGPKAIGIDQIAIRKGHSYRIVVSDLVRRGRIWFGGEDRSEKSMGEFYAWLGPEEEFAGSAGGNGHVEAVSAADGGTCTASAILFDKFHVVRHLGEALDQVRKSEYRRLPGRDRHYIKGQKCHRARRISRSIGSSFLRSDLK
jgi:transposase